MCGIRKKSIIINLPGSEKGSSECFDAVAPVLKHAVALLRDNIELVNTTHQNLNQPVSKVCSEQLNCDFFYCKIILFL